MNKLLSAVVFVVISVVLVASVLLPVVQDAQDGQRITYNNEAYRADAVGTEAITYSWAAGVGTTIGDTVIPANSNYGPQVLLITDAGFIKANFNNTQVSYFEFDGTASAGASITALTISISPADKIVTVSDITASSTIGDFTFSYTDWAFVPSTTGDYIMWSPYSVAKNIHAETGAESYAVFQNGATWALSFRGDDLTTALNEPTYETDFTGTPVSGYDGLVDYSLIDTGGDYTVNVGGTDYAAKAFVSERSATGINSNNGDSAITLFGIIPVLITLGIVAVIARFMVYRND